MIRDTGQPAKMGHTQFGGAFFNRDLLPEQRSRTTSPGIADQEDFIEMTLR